MIVKLIPYNLEGRIPGKTYLRNNNEGLSNGRMNQKDKICKVEMSQV